MCLYLIIKKVIKVIIETFLFFSDIGIKNWWHLKDNSQSRYWFFSSIFLCWGRSVWWPLKISETVSLLLDRIYEGKKPKSLAHCIKQCNNHLPKTATTAKARPVFYSTCICCRSNFSTVYAYIETKTEQRKITLKRHKTSHKCGGDRKRKCCWFT